MLHRYFRAELHHLHQASREFARAYPDDAGFLAEPGSDADVERLLEGLAFLTARLRLKLDDALPELVEPLVEAIWPQLLRPLPSFTVLRFEPLPQARQALTPVPRGSVVEGGSESGRCRFTTSWDLVVAPLAIAGCQLRREGRPELRLSLKMLGPAGAAGATRLRLFLHGDPLLSSGLRLALLEHVTAISVHAAGGVQRSVPAGALRAVGFADDEAVLPAADQAYAPFRLLQEWCCCPEKFQFVDLELGQALAGLAGECELRFVLDRVPAELPTLPPDAVQLNCVPAVNLFDHAAEPVLYDGGSLQLPLRPLAEREHELRLVEILEVSATQPGGGGELHFTPAIDRLGGDGAGPWYTVLRRPAIVGDGQELVLALDLDDARLEQKLQFSVEARCSNGAAAGRLGVGSLREPGAGCPPGLSCSNISKPSPERLLPLGEELLWRHHAALDLHRRGLGGPDARERFLTLLDLADLPALVDRREEQRHLRLREAVTVFSCRPAELALAGGSLGGIENRLELDDDAYAGEGGVYVFAQVVDHLLAMAVSANAASRLHATARRSGASWSFPIRSGTAVLV